MKKSVQINMFPSGAEQPVFTNKHVYTSSNWIQLGDPMLPKNLHRRPESQTVVDWIDEQHSTEARLTKGEEVVFFFYSPAICLCG